MRSPILPAFYDATQREDWDTLVQEARNGCFWFERDFLEYHGSRFEDVSMIFRDKRDRILAVLPAHVEEDGLRSHGGLPFCGLILSPHCTHENAVAIFAGIQESMHERGWKHLTITQVPECYWRHTAGDPEFLLHNLGAQCVHTSLVALAQVGEEGRPMLISKARWSELQRLRRKYPYEFSEEQNPEQVWPALLEFLQIRSYRPPIHSVEQMVDLKRKFPGQIRILVARDEGGLAGGIVLFLFDRVMRFQYSFRVGENRGDGLSMQLFSEALGRETWRRPFFDMGTSVEPDTGKMDLLLLQSKELFGARGVGLRSWRWEPWR